MVFKSSHHRCPRRSWCWSFRTICCFSEGWLNSRPLHLFWICQHHTQGGGGFFCPKCPVWSACPLLWNTCPLKHSQALSTVKLPT